MASDFTNPAVVEEPTQIAVGAFTIARIDCGEGRFGLQLSVAGSKKIEVLDKGASRALRDWLISHAEIVTELVGG